MSIVKKFLITGGCGFIGSALVRNIIKKTNYKVLNIDKLTYAGDLNSLIAVKLSPESLPFNILKYFSANSFIFNKDQQQLQ